MSVDMFNALNTDTMLDYNQAYSPTGDLAGADDRVDGAHDEDHGAVGLLKENENGEGRREKAKRRQKRHKQSSGSLDFTSVLPSA